MSRHSHCLTLEIGNSALEVVAEFDMNPGEPLVMFLPNGDPGHPGSPPEAELISVHVTDWTVGDESRERGDSSAWEYLDRMATVHLLNEWVDRFEDDCLESITELEPDDY